MTPRERELAALRRELPDRIPLDVIWIDDPAPLAQHLGIRPAEVYDRLGIDGRLVSAAYTGAAHPAPAGALAWDAEWGTAAVGDYGTSHRYPLAGVTKRAPVEQYLLPDPGDYDYRAAAAAARALRHYAVRGPYWKPLFCQVCALTGMEEALALMVSAPAVFEALLERVFAVVYAYCERLLDACGDDLPIFCLGDDFATQRGLLFDPALWRRFLKPRYARLFALGKSRGKFVWFHSCGNILAVLPDLIDLGLDVWETIQLHTLPLAPEALKREYGRHLALFGGINTQRLPFATPDEVRAEVGRCIAALGRGGGYLCGPDHHLRSDVPVANVLALFESAAAFRAAGYTR